ncbi:MAG TPA: BsuBI/PstI family type II restriction endonuclease [Blastocatellia bacterium]
MKQIVEVFATVFVGELPFVLLLSDAEHKALQMDQVAISLSLKIYEHEKMPDVILYSAERNILYVIEAVTSAGAMTPARIKDIEAILLPDNMSFGIEYFTAFPDRSVFKRFVEDIAWGTQVWLANEPFGVVIFRRVR